MENEARSGLSHRMSGWMMSEDAETETLEKLPLDAWHRAKGARMVPFAGYEMPIQYEGILAEHEWTRSHAGLFDVSHMGQLVFSAETLGVPVAEALETLLPTEFKSWYLCRQRYSLLLAPDGGILDDLMVTRLPVRSPFAAETGSDERGIDRFYMVVNGATKWDDIAHLRERLPDQVVINHLAEQSLLALQGPAAVAALESVIAGVENLYFMEGAVFDWDGQRLLISRSGYTGEDGFEISVPAAKVRQLADELCAQPEVKPIGLGARDSLRLEAGLPLYGHDMTPEIDPVSAGLAFAISKARRQSGGFPGAEPILKLLAEGSPTRRVGLALEGRMAAREGAEVFAGDAKVGSVTSGGFSPTLGHPIAMAFVAAAHSSEGTELEIEVRGKRLSARVVAMPFVPHRYHRKGAA
jgi:glycine cleavage system T protein (aminomethyltransferase)